MTARRDPAAPRGDGVWLVAVAAFTVVALALTGVAIWSKWPASGGSPSAGNVLFWSAAYFLVLAVPAGLPATLLGAWLARHLLARHPDGLTLSAWLLRGTTAGALLGEFGCIPWFVLAAGDLPANALSRVILVGGTSGLIVGAAVALWCWRVSPSA